MGNKNSRRKSHELNKPRRQRKRHSSKKDLKKTFLKVVNSEPRDFAIASKKTKGDRARYNSVPGIS